MENPKIKTLEIVLGDGRKIPDEMTLRIAGLMDEIASETGILLPNVRITHSSSLKKTEYEFCIDGKTIAKDSVFPDRYLAFDPGGVTEKIQGIETIDPAFETPALWIEASTKDQAEDAGYIVVSAVEIIGKHFEETVRKHLDSISAIHR